jgi:hypothetical protein
MKNDGGMILTGENRRSRTETCPRATLSTTNPTWIDPGANPGLLSERPATNCLSHGTAKMDLREIGFEDVDWIPLAQYLPTQGCCKHSNERSDSINGGEFDYASSCWLLIKQSVPGS